MDGLHWLSTRVRARRPALPEIPAGTRLTLRPDDWYSKPGVRAIYYRDLRVVSVHPDNADAAWIYAHEMECAYETSHCTKPWCQEVRVALGALWLVADRLAERR